MANNVKFKVEGDKESGNSFIELRRESPIDFLQKNNILESQDLLNHTVKISFTISHGHMNENDYAETSKAFLKAKKNFEEKEKEACDKKFNDYVNMGSVESNANGVVKPKANMVSDDIRFNTELNDYGCDFKIGYPRPF